jgi:hypothetical protein
MVRNDTSDEASLFSDYRHLQSSPCSQIRFHHHRIFTFIAGQFLAANFDTGCVRASAYEILQSAQLQPKIDRQ